MEEVLPSLREQGVCVYLMTKQCDTPGVEGFSDQVEEASDTPLPQALRSDITFKSPAIYIYTSGTTGEGEDGGEGRGRGTEVAAVYEPPLSSA